MTQRISRRKILSAAIKAGAGLAIWNLAPSLTVGLLPRSASASTKDDKRFHAAFARLDEFIAAHGMDQYARWHLGVDTSVPEDRKARYKFPYGDFDKVHRCAVLSAEVRAGQYKHMDVELAAAHLHGMLDTK